MPENILERAFERATPGFDSRVALLNTQAERIRQNNAMAQEQAQKILEEEREYQRRLALEQAKSDMTLGRQAQLAQFRHELDAPEKQLNMVNRLRSDSLEIQNTLTQRYSDAMGYGFVPNFRVDVDESSMQPVVSFKMTDEEGQDQLVTLTALEFNNQFSDYADAAELMNDAQRIINDTNVGLYSTEVGAGRTEVKQMHDRILGGDLSEIPNLRRAVTSLNQMITPEVNQNFEIATNLNANFGAARDLLNDPYLSTNIADGRRRWFRQNIKPINNTMSINKMIATASQNLEASGLRDSERSDYESLISYLNSIKNGLNSLGMDDVDFGRLTLNPSWDFSTISSEGTRINIEGQQVDDRTFRNTMRNVLIDPNNITTQDDDAQVVQNSGLLQRATSAFRSN